MASKVEYNIVISKHEKSATITSPFKSKIISPHLGYHFMALMLSLFKPVDNIIDSSTKYDKSQ